MQVRRVEAPSLPVSMELVKQHCRIDEDDTSQDLVLELYVRAAMAYGESLTGRVWGESRWTIAGFRPDRDGNFVLPLSPVTGVSGVDGLEFSPSTLIPNSNPFLEIGERDPWHAVVRADWPDDPVLEVTAGWPPDRFPEVFTQWLLVKVAAKYAQREDIAGGSRNVTIEFPRDFVDGLLDPYKRVWRM